MLDRVAMANLPFSYSSTDDKYIISIDRKYLKKDAFVELLQKIRLELLIQEAGFDEGIEELGEEIKADWWEKNKHRFISQTE